MRNNFVELPVSTRDGTFIAHYSAKGLAEIDWPKVKRASSRAVSGRRRDDESQISPASKELVRDSSRRLLRNKIHKWHRMTEAALKKILAGREPKTFPPLDLAGTEFQKSVWRALRAACTVHARAHRSEPEEILIARVNEQTGPFGYGKCNGQCV